MTLQESLFSTFTHSYNQQLTDSILNNIKKYSIVKQCKIHAHYTFNIKYMHCENIVQFIPISLAVWGVVFIFTVQTIIMTIYYNTNCSGEWVLLLACSLKLQSRQSRGTLGIIVRGYCRRGCRERVDIVCRCYTVCRSPKVSSRLCHIVWWANYVHFVVRRTWGGGADRLCSSCKPHTCNEQVPCSSHKQ